MKVLLDECLPRKLKQHLSPHECFTVPELGWSGEKNGELLSIAEQKAFEVFITLDQGIEYQQNLTARGLGIIVIRARSSRLPDLLHYVPDVLTALSGIRPGDLLRIPSG